MMNRIPVPPGGGPHNYANIPVPDPSTITTEQIDKAKTELRSDYEARIKGIGDLLTTRIEAMDRAATVLAENVNRVPTLLDREASRLERLFEEKFRSVEKQFNERDVRADAMQTAAKEATAALGLAGTTAVNAALQAQKESAFATQQFSAEAIKKSEAGFTNEINSLKLLINATRDGLSATIADLRSRLDRGEGGSAGVKVARDETHMTVGTVVGIVGGITGVLSLVALIVFGVASASHTSANPTVVSPAVVPVAPAR